MKVDRELIQADLDGMLARARAVVREACEQHGCPTPPVNWGWRMRTTRGRVSYRTGSPVITLNPRLYVRSTPEGRDENAKHEAAHAIVWHRHGGAAKAHGREWRAVMASLGVAAKRCHDVDTAGLKRRQRRWHVTCGRCGSGLGVMTTRRLNGLRRAVSLRANCCGPINPRDLRYTRA